MSFITNTVHMHARLLQIFGLSHPAGTRSSSVHEVEAKVFQQAQPVPHGFLAQSIQVWGPFELDQVGELHRPCLSQYR